MYISIVTYHPANGKSDQEIIASFHNAAPMFQGVAGLVRKYFCFDEEAGEGTSIYVWEDRQSAELFFTTPAFMDRFMQTFGCEPDIKYAETKLVVDGPSQ